MLEESEEGYLGVEESVVVISTRMRGDDSEGRRKEETGEERGRSGGRGKPTESFFRAAEPSLNV
jgi:hypothetical protein